MLSFQLNQKIYTKDANIIKFDHNHELLWVGDTTGCLKSYNQGSVYSSTAVSHDNVVDVHIDSNLIYAIGPSTLKCINHRGLPKLFRSGLQGLSCLTKSHKYLHLGGDSLTDIDVATNSVVHTRNYPTTRIKSYMNNLYTSDKNELYIIDIRSDECLAMTHSNGFVTNIECFGNYVLTTGTTLQNSLYTPDPFVTVFDIRTLKVLKVIPFSGGAVHLKSHPRVSSAFFIGSMDGNLICHDIVNNRSTNCKPLNVITAEIDISLSGDCVGAIDNFGSVNIFTSNEDAKFNVPHLSMELEYATYVPFHPVLPTGSSFSLIEKPIRGPLGFLSDDMSIFTNKKIVPPPIDPAILKVAKYNNSIGYAPNLNLFKRNQYHFGKVEKQDSVVFHSQKKNPRKRSVSANSNASSTKDYENKKHIPDHYISKHIKYSKFGVEDFDFTVFNQTKHPGLENHIKNCYLNSLLLLYYFIPDFNNFCTNHILAACDSLNCFICELGFLFKMLDTAQGVNCQASNFLMAFSNNPKTSLLHLSEPLDSKKFHEVIQKSNSFILEQIYVDSSLNEKKLFEDYFGYKYEISKVCRNCMIEVKSSSLKFVLDLNYKLDNDEQCSFEKVLHNSLNSVDKIKKLCKDCGKATIHEVSKNVVKLPNVMLINTNTINLAHKSIYWTKLNKFQKDISGKLSLALSYSGVEYDLKGVLCQILTEGNKEHLISQLHKNEWVHFNDFLVQTVPEYEVVQNPKGWKSPSIFMYRKHRYIELPINTLDESVMIEFLQSSSTSIAPILSPSVYPVIPLQEYENIGSGFLCALDAEFVSLQEELVEFKSDGSKTIKRPCRLHLARVSILRGEGFHEKKPFIDDYIIPKEEIQDYLTQFSGIKPGDLDPKTSRKRLLHLKTVYKKIRWLIDLGCVFVGHGLKKDLRIISICSIM
eukprot:NODE_92_length_21718_cov_0.361950.p3 type:complete len:924 gc:universal NODE_92_length_21718_cov_0.361950:13991-16762(+)